jgi:aspartate aminotransferase-like enzyme
MGLRLFSASPSDSLTAVWLPEGVEWGSFNGQLKSEGITVAGGQGEYTGKIFRVSHLGYYDQLDVVAVVAGVERALEACGYQGRLGEGVRAVQRALS